MLPDGPFETDVQRRSAAAQLQVPLAERHLRWQIMWRVVYTSLFAGIAFGIGMGALFFVPVAYLLGLLSGGIFLSAVAGVMFGIAVGWFAYVAEKEFRAQSVTLSEGEILLHQGPANHFVGKEAVGGWLRLTNERLFFESHGMNHLVHGWEAPLREIRGVSLCLSCKVVPNGIRVSTSQGIRQFVVAGRREWKRKIGSALGNLPNLRLAQEIHRGNV